MPEMHLRHPDLHIVRVDHLQKKRERTQTFKEAGDSRYIYQNDLDKACFQHEMACGDFKDLTRRTASDFMIKHLILLKTRNILDINVDLLQWFINFLIKKLQVEQLKIKIFLIKN